MATHSLPVLTFRDASVVFFVVVVIQQVRREADRRRDQEHFASTRGLSVIQDYEIEAEGGGRERRRGTWLDDRARDVSASDLGPAAVLDDRPVSRKEHEVEHLLRRGRLGV